MSNKMDRPLVTVDGRTLMDRPLEPPNFVVDTLISQGLHILAGSPKVGKSWLALWLAVTVAKGEPVWGMSVKQGTTLYLCLEDSVLRIQNRLFEITEDAPDSVHFCTECAPIGQGLEEQVEGFLVAHPDTVLVLVDTLQMVRPVHDATYANDYRDLSVLKRLADKHGIAILLIHHLRKETADDVFNRKPMVLHRAHTMKPEQNHFTCRTYKKDGAEVCSAHYIREVALKEIVLETIRRATEFARSDPERFAAYIQQKQSTEVAKEIRGVERELSTMRKRDGELDVVFKRMYEDSALGRVSNEQFRLLSEAYSKEKAQLAEAIPATEERLEKLRSSMANAKNFIAKARKFTDMTELTPELLRTFVAKIIVYEKEVKYSKHAPQKIHICFRDFNLNETDDMLLCGETTEKADSTIALPA